MTVNEIVERYVRVWNLPSEQDRRAEIERIWAPGAVQYTPESVHHDLYARVTGAYQELVEAGVHRFVPGGPVHAHHGSVAFPVDMIVNETGRTAWQGLIVLLLDDDERVRLDYQYNVA